MQRNVSVKGLEDLIYRIAQCYAYSSDQVLVEMAEETCQRGELLLLALSCDSKEAQLECHDAFANCYLALCDYTEL